MKALNAIANFPVYEEQQRWQGGQTISVGEAQVIICIDVNNNNATLGDRLKLIK
jgi:hypothetical protein